MTFDENRLMAERARLEGWLQEQDGVTGTGVGLGRDGQACLKVYTDHMPAQTKQTISMRLADSGIPFEFEETGEFRAF
jgi:hypothetical protein